MNNDELTLKQKCLFITDKLYEVSDLMSGQDYLLIMNYTKDLYDYITREEVEEEYEWGDEDDDWTDDANSSNEEEEQEEQEEEDEQEEEEQDENCLIGPQLPSTDVSNETCECYLDSYGPVFSCTTVDKMRVCKYKRKMKRMFPILRTLINFMANNCAYKDFDCTRDCTIKFKYNFKEIKLPKLNTYADNFVNRNFKFLLKLLVDVGEDEKMIKYNYFIGLVIVAAYEFLLNNKVVLYTNSEFRKKVVEFQESTYVLYFRENELGCPCHTCMSERIDDTGYWNFFSRFNLSFDSIHSLFKKQYQQILQSVVDSVGVEVLFDDSIYVSMKDEYIVEPEI
jgi:hypothetical protein